jgi:putative transposase
VQSSSPFEKLGLIVTPRVAYKVTTKHKHSDKVAPNLLNQNFNPVGKNEIWAGDVTYLKQLRAGCT